MEIQSAYTSARPFLWLCMPLEVDKFRDHEFRSWLANLVLPTWFPFHVARCTTYAKFDCACGNPKPAVVVLTLKVRSEPSGYKPKG